MYNLYQYQCYWYAHTVCEALKRLFPDCHETTENGGRSRYLGVKIDKADSVEAVCEEYHIQWARIENAAEERRKVKVAEAQQLRMEGRTEERARCQVEIDQVTRQKEEERRQKEEERRQKEEAVRRAEEEARQKEEERRQKEEAVRKLEEMQAEMDRMRAQYERQAV
jgi:membrane protein involved in colicin uptake